MSANDELACFFDSPSEPLRAIGARVQRWQELKELKDLISHPHPEDPVEVRVAHALPRDVWDLICREQSELFELDLDLNDSRLLTNGMLNTVVSYCPNLVRLSIPNCENATEITNTAFLPHLIWLDISGCRYLTDLIPLAQHSAQLTHLNLNALPQLTDDLLTTFLSRNPRLTSLTVAHPPLPWMGRDEFLRPLPHRLTSPSVQRITNLSAQWIALDLSYLRTPNMLEVMAGASWPQLNDLALRTCYVDHESLIRLVRQMPQLTRLDLAGNHQALTDGLLRDLAETCPNLQVVDLRGDDEIFISQTGIEWLSQHYPTLQVLVDD